MASKYSFRFPLEHGLHARPASVLRDTADSLSSSVCLVNERNGAEANAKSVLSLVAADIHLDDPCVLVVDGENETNDLASMTTFLTEVFPGCDEPLPQSECPDSETGPLPRIVELSGAVYYRGTAACKGVAEASAYLLEAEPLPDVPTTVQSIEHETNSFDDAVSDIAVELTNSLACAANTTESDVIKAHLAILQDPEYRVRVHGAVSTGSSAGQAILAAQAHYAALLGASESAYLRERALDVRDVSVRLLHRLYPSSKPTAKPTPEGRYILVCEDLAPSDFLAQDKSRLAGIAMSEGGLTSHTVILARAAGIPCVVGAENIERTLSSGDALILDARRGLILPEPPEDVRRYYSLEQDRALRRIRQLAAYMVAEGRTADGRRVEIAANAGTLEEAEAAFANGAEGIGLFRTELLFMDRSEPPAEDEQYDVYSRLVSAADGKPVIIRTLDIGGDKPVPYMGLPAEPNPFLGYRAVRFYPEYESLLLTQLRAILRAAAAGPIRVMVPMVSCVEEVRYVKELVARATAELAGENQPCGSVEVGIMVEVPSAAMTVDLLASEADFFSIGTNDLAQYLMAVDRGNRKIGRLAGLTHPAFLRMLMKVVDDAHAAGKWVGMCGEMAGTERLAPILVGLGLDELSMAGPSVPAMKAQIARLRTPECRSLLETAASQPTTEDTDAALGAFTPSGEKPGVLDASITNLRSDARSRAEAIKELVNLMSLSGRLGDPDLVEDAIWRREDEYPTGVGYGFAIPHCKSKDVHVNSIGLLKLKEPITWQDSDEEPVSIVLMLAIREADHGTEHLRIFAKLARKIMSDDFRERLQIESDVDEIVGFIQSEIE